MTDAAMDKSSRPETTIEISLGKPQQLFNSFGPSPFHDRDLDHDADEYSSAGLRKPRCSFRSSWSFICRRASYGAPISPALERAIHNYFAYQQQQSRRRLHLILHDGRIALAVGIAFLFVCILIRQVAYSSDSGTVRQGAKPRR